MFSPERISKESGKTPDSFRPQLENYEGSDIEHLKDELFESYMLQRLTASFFDELEDYVDDDEAIDEMRAVLAMCDDEDVYAALSLPAELRDRKFSMFKEALAKGEKSPKDLIADHIATSKRHGFSVGYHTSPFDIKPDDQGRWSVKGTEPDHRDDDLMMAYYSKKYRHLFKKKDPKFVYIVRTETDTHKTDGNWSRASELSIVDVVPFENVFNFVESTARDIEKKNGDQSVAIK